MPEIKGEAARLGGCGNAPEAQGGAGGISEFA
jgi:hypothetical protein